MRQALVSSTGTFWDTVVVCAMTGLVLVNSGEWAKGLKGAALTKAAFSDFHIVGPIILTMGLLTFVFLHDSWMVVLRRESRRIPSRNESDQPYRWLWVIAVLVGSVLSLSTVWSLADVTNGLMAIPNLISLIALNGVIVAETRRY